MVRFNKKRQKKEEMVTIPKKHYDQMLFELSLLHRTQFALDYLEEFPAFDGEGYTDIVRKVIKFCMAHAPIASKTDKQLRIDIRNVVDNCTGLCYLKGDDFGAHPIQKTNKKKLIHEIHKYITQGVDNAKRVTV